MYGETSPGKKVSILNFLITIVLVALLFYYVSMAAMTGDALWFWPLFEEMPSQVVIHCYGQEKSLEGTSEDATAIASLLNEQISGDKRWDELNLTDPTHEYYMTDAEIMVLELFYAEPIRIHLPNRFFSGIDSLLVPLDGRYADTSIIFGLIDGRPAGSSFHVGTNQPLIDYLAQEGLCSKP